MKLKAKIILVAIVPIIILTIFTVYVISVKSEEVVGAEITTALKGNAISFRDTIELDTVGDYMVDENGVMRKGEFDISESQSMIDNISRETGIILTVCFGDTRMVTGVKNSDGSYAVGTKLSKEVVDTVIGKGEIYEASNVNVNGIPHYAYYLPIFNEGDSKPVGVIFAGQNQAEAEAKIRSIVNLVLTVAIPISIVGVILIFLIVNSIINSLRSCVSIVTEVSKGNLTVKTRKKDLRRRDEVGEISRAIDVLLHSLTKIMGDIKEKSSVLKSASETLDTTSNETAEVVGQVEKAVADIAAGATSQAEETQRATTDVMFMGDMVGETIVETSNLHNNAEVMRKNSVIANEILEELQKISTKSSVSIEEIYNQTLTTNDSAMKIKEATNLITSIATETNLLSLNAAIEAARAGDQGRGFAVVAAQIQKLAEQSNSSAKVIEKIITTLLVDSAKAVETMEDVKKIIGQQNDNVKQTGEIFAAVMDGIDASISGVNNISEKSKKLDESRINVVDIVQNLTAIAEENAASTEETSASTAEVASIVTEVADSAKQLREIADGLESNVSIFKM